MDKMIPMDLLDAFNRKYPKAFKMIDEIFSDKNTKWHKEYCYCPVGLALAYMQEYRATVPGDVLGVAADAGRMAVLSSWRHAKSVYRISDGLTAEFIKSINDDIQVTSDLLTIPEYCIYIDTQKGFADIDGLFVMFDDDHARGHKELYIIPVQGGEMVTAMYLVIPEEPELLSMILGKSWIEAHEDLERYRKIHTGISMEDEENYFKVSRKIIRYVINVLMYLSAVNAEVKFVNSKSLRTHGKAKDTIKGVKRYSVGEKLGVRLKKFRNHVVRYETDREESGGTHKSPIMHIRRAHYHTYLVGKGRKDRRVKWLPPIVVNAEGEEIDYISINEVDE